jgi:hypothetical protein
MLQWIQKGDRMHEVWREASEHELAFVQGLPHQSEVALLEIAQPTMK